MFILNYALLESIGKYGHKYTILLMKLISLSLSTFIWMLYNHPTSNVGFGKGYNPHICVYSEV